jgi:hypothetical protein
MMSSKEIEACNFEKYGVSASYTRACEEFEFRANLQLLLHAAMTVVTPHPLVASMIESIAVSCENAKIKEEMVHHLAIKRYKKFSPDIEFYKIQYTLKARDKKKSVLGQSASSYEVSYEIQIRKMNKGDEDRFLLDRRDYESKIQQDTILLLLKSVKIDFDQIILPDDDTKVDYALTVVSFYKLFLLLKEQAQNLNILVIPDERINIKEYENRISLSNIQEQLMKFEEDYNLLRLKIELRKDSGPQYDALVAEIRKRKERKSQLFVLGENELKVRNWKAFYWVHWAVFLVFAFINWTIAVPLFIVVWTCLFYSNDVAFGKQVYRTNNLDNLL